MLAAKLKIPELEAVPAVIAEEGEIADHFRTAYIHQSVAEIGSLLESENTVLMTAHRTNRRLVEGEGWNRGAEESR